MFSLSKDPTLSNLTWEAFSYYYLHCNKGNELVLLTATLTDQSGLQVQTEAQEALLPTHFSSDFPHSPFFL